jgi:hypothetical protein
VVIFLIYEALTFRDIRGIVEIEFGITNWWILKKTFGVAIISKSQLEPEGRYGILVPEEDLEEYEQEFGRGWSNDDKKNIAFQVGSELLEESLRTLRGMSYSD